MHTGAGGASMMHLGARMHGCTEVGMFGGHAPCGCMIECLKSGSVRGSQVGHCRPLDAHR
eukprot:1142431-Pelagomonas_calceolata.AAC.8